MIDMRELRKISSIALMVKEGNKAGEATCLKVQEWLNGRGIPFCVVRHPSDHLLNSLPPGMDLLLIFAGDGTIVSAAREGLDFGLPIAGINFGRVGFLAELAADTWEKALDNALANGLTVESRMTLRFSLFRGSECLEQGEVVNDVVVTRGKVARLVRLHLGVNGVPFFTLRSDGLILSTPTGASGYSSSAGGPLLLPTLNVYVVAAICPFLHSFPPMVLASDTRFSVIVGEAAPDLYLTLDGQDAYTLAEGDRLEVSGVQDRLLMADFGIKDYFERLRKVGFVQ